MPYVRTASVVSILTIVSSIFGFFREVFIAKTFGVGSDMDCFVFGFTIISFIFLIFNPTAIQAIFMPYYKTLLNKGNNYEATAIFNSAFLVLSTILLACTLLIAFGSPYYVPYLSPGFNIEQVELTSRVVRIMSPLMFLFGLSSLYHSVCNAHHSFVGPLLAQIANNVLVIGIIAIISLSTVVSLSYIFTAGAVVSFMIIYVFSRQFLQRQFHLATRESLSHLLNASYPLIGLILADQVAAIIQKSIASELSSGSISSLNYSAKLIGFPVGIFAVAISSVLFPIFINHSGTSEDDKKKVLIFFDQGVVLLLYSLIPASLFFGLKSEAIVSMLFSSKNFDMRAIDMTSSALFYYSLGVIFQGMLVYLNRFYFAYKASSLFVRVGLLSVVIHVILCFVLANLMGHVGIALATSLYAFFNVALLILYLSKISPIGFDYGILVRPAIYSIVTVSGCLFFQSSNDILGVIQAAVIIVVLFFGSALVSRDVYLKELLKYFMKAG